MLEKASENTQLIEWNRIRSEIIRLLETDISLLTQDDAIAMSKVNYGLQAVQQWARDSKQRLEIQNDIAKSRLHLNRKQGEWIEANIPEDGGYKNVAKNSRVTLSDIGIGENDSPKFRILARIPKDKFEAYISESKEIFREITTNDACRLWKDNIANKWTGDQESYTPSLYIEAARIVMGSIDLDPASNEFAQQTVKAGKYYTKEDDGLRQPWEGNIFLNPPYSHPEVSQFVDKLLNELKDGQQAILLTNNNTDTTFFHKAAKRATALCFTRGRISFCKPDGQTKTNPTNGQVFFYFGENVQRFVEVFGEFGLLVKAL